MFSLKARISELEEREKVLLQQQQEHESEFGHKRARFRELFLQKECKLHGLFMSAVFVYRDGNS